MLIIHGGGKKELIYCSIKCKHPNLKEPGAENDSCVPEILKSE
jgi:hypothetical protein